MQFDRMPRTLAECESILSAEEALTGYKVKTLYVGTTLCRNYGRDGGFILKDNDRPIIHWFADGRVKINVARAVGAGSAQSRCARINAALPPRYRLSRRWEGAAQMGYDLSLDGRRVADFANTFTFTPYETAA